MSLVALSVFQQTLNIVIKQGYSIYRGRSWACPKGRVITTHSFAFQNEERQKEFKQTVLPLTQNNL